MKKKLFSLIMSNLLHTYTYSKSVYPHTSRITQKIEKNEVSAQEIDNNVKPEPRENQEVKNINQKLETLYWAHQDKLIEELKGFDYQASAKALKYLRKNISKHLEKHQKSLVQFAEEIEKEARVIETSLHELDTLIKKSTDHHLLPFLKELRQQGFILKRNLFDLISIVNALLIARH